jgi:hypothetical protein
MPFLSNWPLLKRPALAPFGRSLTPSKQSQKTEKKCPDDSHFSNLTWIVMAKNQQGNSK